MCQHMAACNHSLHLAPASLLPTSVNQALVTIRSGCQRMSMGYGDIPQKLHFNRKQLPTTITFVTPVVRYPSVGPQMHNQQVEDRASMCCLQVYTAEKIVTHDSTITVTKRRFGPYCMLRAICCLRSAEQQSSQHYSNWCWTNKPTGRPSAA